MTYPATNSNEATKLIIDGGNQLHEIINEDAETTITTESGEIPSVRKAITDTFLFQEPIAWNQGSDETVFNQLRTFNNETYWAPTATLSTPIPMGVTPIGDSNWKLAPVGSNRNIIKGWDTSAQEELLPTGSNIYPVVEELQNGDTVPAGTTHLRVLVGGKSTLVSITPIVSGVVSSLTETGATIGGTPVEFRDLLKSVVSYTSVQEMVQHAQYEVEIGSVVQAGAGFWRLTSISNPMTLADFEPLQAEYIAEDFEITGNGVTDDIDNIDYAKATKLVILFNHLKKYAVSRDVAIRSGEKLRGTARPYLNKGATFLWIGAGTPDVGVAYMANNDDRQLENITAVADAEISNILIDGNNIADVGFYSNYTSGGTTIRYVFSRNTLGVAILITKCFYSDVDWLSARGNRGAGVAIGQYTPFMYSGGDAAVNALGDVHIEGHSCGDDLAWDPNTTSATGFGLGLFGTIHKCKFIVTLEANWGSALHENVTNGEFDVYGYVESSAKNITVNNPNAGDHSVHLLGSPSIVDKCSIDIVLRTNQKVYIRANNNVRRYKLCLQGSDSGVGITDNDYAFYKLDANSRFNLISQASKTALHEKIIASGQVDLNASSGFTPEFYIRPVDRATPILRIIPKDPIGDVSTFNYQVYVDGALITTRALDLDNTLSYTPVEQSINLNDGHFRLQGTQSIGAAANAYYEIVLYEALDYAVQ